MPEPGPAESGFYKGAASLVGQQLVGTLRDVWGWEIHFVGAPDRHGGWVLEASVVVPDNLKIKGLETD